MITKVSYNTMPKVALINPGKDQRYAIQEPLSLGFIASFLEKHNIEVKIIDELAGQNVENELNKFCPNIVGVTATTPLFPDACRIADMCRKQRILTVIGGVHVSVMPEEALQHADIVVKGEGELAMLDIARDNNINSRIISRPYITNIDQVPPPARHLMNMNFYLKTKDRTSQSYLYFVPPHTPTAAILTSRGCPYDCIFCHNTWKNLPYRFHNVERVITEIDNLKEKYGIGAFFFIEDNLFVNKKRVRAICEIMKEKKIDIPWGANSRVDHVDLEILKVAKESGCKQITFGFESGSQRILDILNKKTTVEQNRRAIELCNIVGIIPQGTLMIGNPTETLKDLRETQQFVADNEIESVGICITTPFPGTELWKWCEDRGHIPKTLKWSDFNYQNAPITVCDSVTTDELRKIQLEMQLILLSRRKTPLRFFELLKIGLRNPSKAINSILGILKNPSRIPAVIKRVTL